MNKNQIIEIAVEAGVKAAIEFIEKHNKKQIKSRQDRRLHNTRLLLKHYNLFKDHCESSIDNFKTAMQSKGENAIDILDALEQCNDNVYIESIKKSITRTFTIMTHINEMLQLYNAYCERSNKPEDLRRYRILKAYYIDGDRISDIARRENVDERTYYRDMKESIEKLSSLIFGIDGLCALSE